MNFKKNNEDDFKNILQFTGKCLEKIGDMFINKALMLQKELSEIQDENQKLQLEKKIKQLEKQIELVQKNIKNVPF
ncbi:hypothetical protein ACQKJG_23510 [Priestia megaterium]|uniref:hypothetical protein n=1 Tax=Priestia TaxID=2800373 RepID=UPI001C8EA835|nr:hypothetical protein [Priestia aryabhattai]MBY0029805.1 hypothetical protein [Priestia aryabhattai]